MSEQKPTSEAMALVSPDTTLVAPAPVRAEASEEEKSTEDGSEKEAVSGFTAKAATLIPVSENPVIPETERHSAPGTTAGDRTVRGRRSFFRSGNASSSNKPDSGATVEQNEQQNQQQQQQQKQHTAQQMAHLEQRLRVQRTMGPTAAEAEQRVKALRLEARLAATARGPRVAQEIFRKACATDLCFVLDVTGSMQGYIDAARDQIRSIVDEIHRAFFGEADVRVAVVAYRDHSDAPADQIVRLPFTDSVDDVHDFLAVLTARGGADTAEDVLGGLDAALQLDWRHPTRCIMHLADAPAHGQELHDLGAGHDTWHSGPTPNDLAYRDVLALMVRLEINYVFFRINAATDRMLSRFLHEYAAAAPDAQLSPRNDHYHLDAFRMQQRRAGKTARGGDTFVAGALNGGLHFEEVALGVSFAALSRLVVGGVAASSSRTATRMTASSLSSTSTRWSGRGGSGSGSTGLRSKRAAYAKKKLGDVSEDAELEVLGEEDEEDEEGEDSSGNHHFDTETTTVGIATTTANAVVPLETGPPQWDTPGWLDQTVKFLAFSPDVVDMQRRDSGHHHHHHHSSSLLDRMMDSDDNIPLSTTELTIQRRSRPFAQGALRTASYARTPASTNPLVVKTFKRGGKTLADLAEDMRLQALCKAFALEFNRLVGHEQYSLDFVVVTCLQEEGGGHGACLTLEPLLEETDDARYVKYNNNCGGVSRLGQDAAGGDDGGYDREQKTSEKKRLREEAKKRKKQMPPDEAEPPQAEAMAPAHAHAQASLASQLAALDQHTARRGRLAVLNRAAQAFSHFTFERSRGRMLVVDLQGVGNVLTDPAIHTRDPDRFVLSDTNLGPDGFKLFFATHRCNDLCRRLHLQSNADMIRTGALAFRVDWTTPTSTSTAFPSWRNMLPYPTDNHHHNHTPDMLVCCANKLCGRIVRASTAQAAPAGVHWCGRCFPQLRSSTVLRVCAAPGATAAYHEFEVSAFFFASQGQILPSACPAHGGGVSQPLVGGEKRPKKESLLQRLSCF